MRMLTDYEVSLVAGGTTSSDFYPDGDGPFDDGGGFDLPGGGGGGGVPGGYGAGIWYFVPVHVSVQVGDGPPSTGWQGYWAYAPYDPIGGNYEYGGGGGGQGVPHIDLVGRDCPTDQTAATNALSMLYNNSPTAAALIDAMAANGTDLDLIAANLAGGGAQAEFDPVTNQVLWDPFVYVTGTNTNGSTYTESPIMVLAHELVHAGHANDADYQGADSEALVMQVANQIAGEMNAATGSHYDTSRDSHIRTGQYWTNSSTSTDYSISRPGCP